MQDGAREEAGDREGVSHVTSPDYGGVGSGAESSDGRRTTHELR